MMILRVRKGDLQRLIIFLDALRASSFTRRPVRFSCGHTRSRHECVEMALLTCASRVICIRLSTRLNLVDGREKCGLLLDLGPRDLQVLGGRFRSIIDV